MKKYVIVYLQPNGKEKMRTYFDYVDYSDDLSALGYYGTRVVGKFSYNI